MQVNLDRVNDLAGREWADAVQAVVDAPPIGGDAPASEESDDTVEWWTARLTDPAAGLHDRMTFFWHTVLTTHRWASGDQALLPTQLNLLRTHALGNFRQLLQGFVIDGALIKYLNADSNTARRPNENLARELMELFSVGVGHYGEDDVRAAALAIGGWRVDGDTNAVYHDPERAHGQPVTFLGENRTWDIAAVVDRLCDHPATAARISSLLWYHLVGTRLDAAGASELGAFWQGQNLEIRPLVTRILNDPAFRANHYNRPRSGFEFFAALQALAGFDVEEKWRPRSVGQALYEPPNVAGWPDGDRWLTPDSMLRRSNLLFSFDLPARIPGALEAGVDEILDRCGLFVVSQGTLDTLTNVTSSPSYGEEGVAQLRWRIALSSPEFQLT